MAEHSVDYSPAPFYTVWMSEVSASAAAEDTPRIFSTAPRRANVWYGKSTMAEIAGDAHMSAANLYRYFDNKQELGVACANDAWMSYLSRYAPLCVRATVMAATLVAFCVELARWTHSNTANEPRINELVQMITSERKDVVVWRESRLHGLTVAFCLRQRQRRPDIEDVIDAAQTVHASLILFQLPLLMGMYELPVLEARAASVANLILRGLQTAPSALQ